MSISNRILVYTGSILSSATTDTILAGNNQLSALGITALYGITCDPNGNVYVSDPEQHVIVKITPRGICSIYAGQIGVSGNNGDGSFGPTTSLLNKPMGLDCDKNGVVFVADSGNNQIKKITTDRKVSLIAGNLSGQAGFVNTYPSKFNAPQDVAIDESGNLYVADTENHAIRRIKYGTRNIVTVAGNGTIGDTGGYSTTSRLNFPNSIAVNVNGEVFIGDSKNYKIKKISRNGYVSTYSGSGTRGDTIGKKNVCKYLDIFSLVTDRYGSLFVGDYDEGLGGRVLRVDSEGTSYEVKGHAAIPTKTTGITYSRSRNIYVSETQYIDEIYSSSSSSSSSESSLDYSESSSFEYSGISSLGYSESSLGHSESSLGYSESSSLGYSESSLDYSESSSFGYSESSLGYSESSPGLIPYDVYLVTQEEGSIVNAPNYIESIEFGTIPNLTPNCILYLKIVSSVNTISVFAYDSLADAQAFNPSNSIANGTGLDTDLYIELTRTVSPYDNIGQVSINSLIPDGDAICYCECDLLSSSSSSSLDSSSSESVLISASSPSSHSSSSSSSLDSSSSDSTGIKSSSSTSSSNSSSSSSKDSSSSSSLFDTAICLNGKDSAPIYVEGTLISLKDGGGANMYWDFGRPTQHLFTFVGESITRIFSDKLYTIVYTNNVIKCIMVIMTDELSTSSTSTSSTSTSSSSSKDSSSSSSTGIKTSSSSSSEMYSESSSTSSEGYSTSSSSSSTVAKTSSSSSSEGYSTSSSSSSSSSERYSTSSSTSSSEGYSTSSSSSIEINSSSSSSTSSSSSSSSSEGYSTSSSSSSFAVVTECLAIPNGEIGNTFEICPP